MPATVAVLMMFLQAPSFEALSKKAEGARDANHPAEAVALYKQALQLNPRWLDGWWNLGSITYGTDDYPECAPSFLNLASLKPDSVPAWTMSGLCEYRARNYSAALESLSHAERLGFEEPHELSQEEFKRLTRAHE
jgi:tetratricopeptide (TPR) repeat protein